MQSNGVHNLSVGDLCYKGFYHFSACLTKGTEPHKIVCYVTNDNLKFNKVLQVLYHQDVQLKNLFCCPRHIFYVASCLNRTEKKWKGKNWKCRSLILERPNSCHWVKHPKIFWATAGFKVKGSTTDSSKLSCRHDSPQIIFNRNVINYN